jgi:hypothetical protein
MTVRVSMPLVDSPTMYSPSVGPLEMRPRAGFSPTTPQHDAGVRIDPPPSLPLPTGHSPAATAAAAPPLEPPDVRSRFHGFRQAPFRIDSVNDRLPNSGVLVLPSSTNPASLIRRTTDASKSGT